MNLKVSLHGKQLNLEGIQSFEDLNKSISQIDPQFISTQFSYVDADSDKITISNDYDLQALQEQSEVTIIEVQGRRQIVKKNQEQELQNRITQWKAKQKEILVCRLINYNDRLEQFKKQLSQKVKLDQENLKGLIFQLNQYEEQLKKTQIKNIKKQIFQTNLEARNFYRSAKMIEKSVDYDKKDRKTFEKTIYSNFQQIQQLFDSLIIDKLNKYKINMKEANELREKIQKFKKMIKFIKKDIEVQKKQISKINTYFNMKIIATKAVLKQL